jgi:hypothetical protein
MVCILVQSGAGVFAIEIEKKETITTNPILPGTVLVTVRAGFGFSVIMKSNYLIENTGRIRFYIDGFFIHDIYTLELPEPIPPDATLTLRTRPNFRTFGLGPIKMNLYLYLYENSETMDLMVERFGFIFGPFILMRPCNTYI